MRACPTSLSPWRVAAAAGLLLLAGCATALHRPEGSNATAANRTIAPSTALAADSPMPAAVVVQSADFSLRAGQEGFQTEVRNGTLLYCWTDASIGTRLPTRKCLDEAQLKLRIQQAQRQREAMHHSLAGPRCPPQINCG